MAADGMWTARSGDSGHLPRSTAPGQKKDASRRKHPDLQEEVFCVLALMIC